MRPWTVLIGALLLMPTMAAAPLEGEAPAEAEGLPPDYLYSRPSEPDMDCAPAPVGCQDTPLVVDEGGDTMTGNLRFAYNRGVQFNGGVLTGNSRLRYGSSDVCVANRDTVGCGDIDAVMAGTGLTGGATRGTADLAVDFGRVQHRVGGVCAPGSSIRAIGGTGAVACEPDDDTTYDAGSGLVLRGTTFEPDTSILQARIGGQCAPGSSIRAIGQNGAVACEVDDDTLAGLACEAGEVAAWEGTAWSCTAAGDITAVSAGFGLSGGATSGAATVAVDPNQVQRRVSGACPVGAAIRVVSSTGSVSCEADNVDGGNADLLDGRDSASFQTRVWNICPFGAAIRVINSNGSVSCEADSVDGGNADLLDGRDSSAFQTRVSDTCPSGSAIRVIGSTGSVSCEADSVDGGNAAQLDGLESTQFVRSDAPTAITSGGISFRSGTRLTVNPGAELLVHGEMNLPFTSSVDLNGKVRIGHDRDTDDDSLYFDANESEYLRWNDCRSCGTDGGRFVLSDDLTVQGDAYVPGNVATDGNLRVTGDVKIWGALDAEAISIPTLQSQGNLHVNVDGPDGDSSVFFFNGGNSKGEHLMWDESPGEFVLSDDVTIRGNRKVEPVQGFLGSLDVGDVDVQRNLRVFGSLSVSGQKNFVQPHPTDPAKDIYFSSMEGPEAGIYWRGSGQLENGQARIEFPEEFRLVLSPEGPVTASATLTGDANGLFVAEKATDHILVRETGGGSSAATFDFVVYGVRAGFEDFQVVRAHPLETS